MPHKPPSKEERYRRIKKGVAAAKKGTFGARTRVMAKRAKPAKKKKKVDTSRAAVSKEDMSKIQGRLEVEDEYGLPRGLKKRRKRR